MSTSTIKTPGEALFEELEDLLKQERLAISRFDAASLRRLTEKKLEMLEHLRVYLNNAPDALRRESASKVLGEAEANQALLRHTISALSECLGLRPSSLYDQRARLSSSSTIQTVQYSI
jgi:flagellar biosynthesis/type III secretory pathway chaperone